MYRWTLVVLLPTKFSGKEKLSARQQSQVLVDLWIVDELEYRVCIRTG